MELAIVHPEVERYLHALAPESEPVLREMEREAEARRFPIVGPLVGRLLFVLARAVGAEAVFELGSGYGYSALWFAKGMATGGRVVLTEGDERNLAAARGHFERAGLGDRAVYEPGDGLETIERYPGPFDIVFCDIDKRDYPRALERALPRLRRGGLLVFDNALWSGRVTAPAEDADTAGVQEFNRRLAASPEVVSAVLPLRDGVALAVKL